jgi:hypothetical protein
LRKAKERTYGEVQQGAERSENELIFVWVVYVSFGDFDFGHFQLFKLGQRTPSTPLDNQTTPSQPFGIWGFSFAPLNLI